MKSTLLFADWYKEISINPTSEAVNLREASLKNVTKNSNITFWLDVLKLYLGFDVKSVESYLEFVNEFKKYDSSFPITGNEKIIQILAGCAICFKLDEGISDISNALSMAVMTSNYFNQFKIKTKVPVSDKALEYITHESINFRTVEEQIHYDTDETEFTTSQIDLNESDEIDADSFKEPFGEIDTAINSLNDRINNIQLEINKIQKINKNLLEEVDILWWVFGERSITLSKRFKDLGSATTIFIAAYELSNFIKQSPSIASSEAMLGKILKLTTNKDLKDLQISLNEATNSLQEDIRRRIISEISEKILTFTPCLLSFKKSLDVEEGESWAGTFKKTSIGADCNAKVNSLSLSVQMFRELQFVASYNSCV